MKSAPFWRSSSFSAREAGAPRSLRALRCLLVLTLPALALPSLLQGATPRLLNARQAEVRALAGTRPPGAAAASLRVQLEWDEGSEELQLQPNPSLGVLAE